MAEDYSEFSPYNYCLNNPISNIDPNGMDVIDMGDRIVINGDDVVHYYAMLQMVASGQGSKSNMMEAITSAAKGPGEGSGHMEGALLADDTPSKNPSVSENNRSVYVYNSRDLRVRNGVLKDDNPIGRYILSQEARGNYEILNSQDYWATYGHTLGTYMAFATYSDAAATLGGAAQGGGTQPTPKKFNYIRRYNHAASRALQRGVSQGQVNDALQNPLKVKPVKTDSFGRPSQTYIGKSATVVVNPNTGKIITMWKTGSKVLKSL